MAQRLQSNIRIRTQRKAATVKGSKRIEVEFYSGSRGDERPRSVTIGGRRHSVLRLLSESIEEPDTVTGPRERTHRYRVLTEDGLVLELFRTGDGGWFLSGHSG